MNEPETIRTILEKSKTIAVVGLTDKPDRPSFYVSKYMQQEGYRIIPIHPAVTKVLGEKAYPTLDAAYAVEGKIDLVDVFRASEYVPEIVKDVMRLKIPYLWLQEGVCHEEAVKWAEADGILVVMDRCIYKEHARFARPSGEEPPLTIATRRNRCAFLCLGFANALCSGTSSLILCAGLAMAPAANAADPVRGARPGAAPHGGVACPPRFHPARRQRPHRPALHLG